MGTCVEIYKLVHKPRSIFLTRFSICLLNQSRLSTCKPRYLQDVLLWIGVSLTFSGGGFVLQNFTFVNIRC